MTACAETLDQRRARLAAAEIETRGYLIGEADDFLLADVSRGLKAVALMASEHRDTLPDLNGEDWGSVLRVFAASLDNIHKGSLFANSARARPRSVG